MDESLFAGHSSTDANESTSRLIDPGNATSSNSHGSKDGLQDNTAASGGERTLLKRGRSSRRFSFRNLSEGSLNRPARALFRSPQYPLLLAAVATGTSTLLVWTLVLGRVPKSGLFMIAEYAVVVAVVLDVAVHIAVQGPRHFFCACISENEQDDGDDNHRDKTSHVDEGVDPMMKLGLHDDPVTFESRLCPREFARTELWLCVVGNYMQLLLAVCCVVGVALSLAESGMWVLVVILSCVLVRYALVLILSLHWTWQGLGLGLGCAGVQSGSRIRRTKSSHGAAAPFRFDSGKSES